MNTFFPEIKKNFGFGCMRFPLKDGEPDIPQIMDMVDAFMEAGFNYFDTLKFYMNGKSEGNRQNLPHKPLSPGKLRADGQAQHPLL